MAFPEPDLETAAQNCYVDLLPTLLNGNDLVLGTRPTTLAFVALAQPAFPKDQAATFPISDLIAVISTLATNLPVGAALLPSQFTDIVFSVFKILWLTDQLEAIGQASSAQAAAVLAAFNTAYSVG